MLTFLKDTLGDDLKLKIQQHAATFDELPGVVIIHDLQDGSVAYISERGLKLLGVTAEEIASMPHEEYHSRYFNDEDAKDYVPKIIGLLERNNDDEMISFFQQVRYADTEKWTWHLSSIKIFERDDEGKPKLGISLAIPVDAMHPMTVKAARLLEENNFLRQHIQNFSKLSKREKEILRLTTLGKSAPEIATSLFLSAATVETHRRNIKHKLNCTTTFELSQYARAFDLI